MSFLVIFYLVKEFLWQKNVFTNCCPSLTSFILKMVKPRHGKEKDLPKITRQLAAGSEQKSQVFWLFLLEARDNIKHCRMNTLPKKRKMKSYSLNSLSAHRLSQESQLVIYYCIANYHKTEWLKAIHIYYLIYYHILSHISLLYIKNLSAN